MSKKHQPYYSGEISILFHCIGSGSLIALLLGCFLLEKIMNTGIKFFLCWSCVSILTIIVGLYFRAISRIDRTESLVHIIGTRIIFVVIIVQSLVIAYLFTTYQPSPDQMSQIHTLSRILVIAVIHTIWALSGDDGSEISHPLYNYDRKFLGLNLSEFSGPVFVLSALSTIGLWITIAFLLVGKGNGNIIDTNTKFFFQWTGMSMLTLTTSLVLVSTVNHIRKRTFKPTNTATDILVGAIYPLSNPFFAIFIIQGLAMTYLFANMHHPDPDQMSRIHILSWILFVTATSMFCGAACELFNDGSPNHPYNFPRLVTRISTLSTIGLWITIAALIGSQ